MDQTNHKQIEEEREEKISKELKFYLIGLFFGLIAFLFMSAMAYYIGGEPPRKAYWFGVVYGAVVFFLTTVLSKYKEINKQNETDKSGLDSNDSININDIDTFSDVDIFRDENNRDGNEKPN